MGYSCSATSVGSVPMFPLRSMLLKPGTGGSGMSKTVLKPCPFCGDVDSVHLSTMLSCCSIYAVHCGRCGTYTNTYKRPEEATDAWNMRAPEEEGKTPGNELKSCPFCGGSAEFVGLGGYTNQYSHVYIARIKCQTCHAYIRRFDSIYRNNGNTAV